MATLGRSLQSVTRLLLVILLAISMVASSGPAFAGPAADCQMSHMSGGMGDHGKMGCCPPECAVTCPPAMLPAVALDLPVIGPSPLPVAMPWLDALRSFNPAAVDPPPRTILS